jgi:ribosomal protein L40E
MDVNPLLSKALALEPIEVSTTGGDAARTAADESSADATAQQDLRIRTADEFLAAAAREYQAGNIDQALWHRAADQCGDDAVFVPQCLFCNHANPPGAKFCNDCGSPLHLKLCKQCEAVNGQVAKNCYKCGTELPALSTAPEAAPVSPTLDTTAASATLTGMGFERGHAPLPESVAGSQDVLLPRPGNETAEARDYAVEVVTRAPRSLGGVMTFLFSAAQRTADVISLHKLGATAGRRPLPRLVLAVVLPVALLIAIGVSAYYGYRHQVQPSGLLSTAPPDQAATTGVTASPVNQSGKRATRPDGVNGQPPTPGRSDAAITPQLRVSTSDQAAPAQQLATQGAEVAGAPGAAAGSIAAEPHTTIRAATSRVPLAQAAANPSTSPYRAAAAAARVQVPLSDSRVNAPPDAPRPDACTEAVAALGLCGLTSSRESK